MSESRGKAGKRTLVSPEELKARALELSHAPADDQTRLGGQVGLVVLGLGREWYGIPAPLVHEVVSEPAITPVPLTPEFVAGVLNSRGELVGAIDLAALLGLPRSDGGARFAVVVRREERFVAFIAERVADVEWFAASSLEPVLTTLPAEGALFFEGAFRSGERLITELNVEKVLSHPQLRSLREDHIQEGRV